MFDFIEDDRRTAEISDIGVGRWFYRLVWATLKTIASSAILDL